MVNKPAIAGPEWEFDVRTLELDDDDTVVTWPDLSGQGNDATGVGTPHYETIGWDVNIPAVRLTKLPSVERFDLDGTGFAGEDLTLFAVIEAIDISEHLAIVGSPSSSTPPRRINWWIKSDGSVIFTYQFEPHDVQSAAGVITTGQRLIMTARSSSSLGKMIRANRTQIGTEPARIASLVSYDSAALGVIKDDITGGVGTQYGKDKRFAWISGYRSAASDDEILQMEAWLHQEFFSTPWTPCNPDPGTVWAACN